MTAASLRAIVRGAAHAGNELAFISANGQDVDWRTWESLLAAGARRAALLTDSGVKPGDRVVLSDTTGPALVETILAVNHAGAIPTLLAPPSGLARDAHARFVREVVARTGAPMVLLGEELIPDMEASLAPLRVLPIRDQAPDLAPRHADDEAPVALLQFSSGSTRKPKGVIVPQECFAANLQAIAEHHGIGPADALVSWLPLHHDMGLIAGLFGPAAWGATGVLMDPSTFIHRPSRWLKTISRFRATISVAPNFAYDHCVRLVRDRELAGLDLSSWRIAWNGAEMVEPSTIRAFEERFRSHGLRRNVFVPCYGAAESTLAITSCGPGDPPNVLVLSRSALNADHARLAEPGEPSIAVVSVGRPMPGTSVSIVRHDRVLPEGRIGEIEVWGPSVCPGYVGAGDADLREGRFLSGDLGFVHGGELFITGRKKDMIIVAGRNIYPFDLEHVVRDVAGEKIRRAAAFGVPDPRTGTEQIVIAIERAGRYRMDAQLAHAIRSAAAEAAGTANVEVVELDPVPITSSGKTQRGRARELHLAGRSEGVPTGP